MPESHCQGMAFHWLVNDARVAQCGRVLAEVASGDAGGGACGSQTGVYQKRGRHCHGG